MFDWIIEHFGTHPYAGIAIIFILCGVGLPLPEEIALISAGYLCFKELAEPVTMGIVCFVSIMLGDALPFALGRSFGTRLLRLRTVRLIISPQRLARFDRWFRKRGELVIFFSRFVAGIRVVSYFTAGTMKMKWSRFLILDAAGTLVLVPPLVWVGTEFGGTIEDAIQQVTQIERGILITVLSALAILGGWTWLRWRRRQRNLVGLPTETYIEPSSPVTPKGPRALHQKDSEGSAADDERQAGDIR